MNEHTNNIAPQSTMFQERTRPWRPHRYLVMVLYSLYMPVLVNHSSLISYQTYNKHKNYITGNYRQTYTNAVSTKFQHSELDEL